MSPANLPDLAKTLVVLASELMRAPDLHPDLILTEPDSQGDTLQEALRITLHYVTAMLAYGFPAQDESLRRATEWFATPFPSESQIDLPEMMRLEALLRLHPDQESVQPRLWQLVNQRTATGRFSIDSDSTIFNTAWAVRLLILSGQIDTGLVFIPREELVRVVDEIMPLVDLDKDLALTLNLRHDLKDGLTTEQQERYLQKLVRLGEENRGFWDLTADLMPLVGQMRQHSLAFSEIERKRAGFRRMIVHTCYVIENLSPLRHHYPQIEPVLDDAVSLWWDTFCESPIERLRGMFPKPYDFLMVLCRTLIALRAYAGRSLAELGAVYAHWLLSQRDRAEATVNNENILQALRHWIQIDMERQPVAMTLGLSGADVVRVYPIIRSPLFEDERLTLSDSLIVKYGPKEEIELERKHYTELPEAIRDCFVSIPQDTYEDPKTQRSYVIMRDLFNYQTFYELRNRARIYQGPDKELAQFLLRMHRGGTQQVIPAPQGLLNDIYLLPMQEHISTIFNALISNNLLVDGNMQHTEALRSELLGLIGRLVGRQSDLECFPRACMHGDLHTRNIMIREVAQRDTLLIKLIDLEKFRRDGDAAMDIGQFMIDCEVAILGEAGKRSEGQRRLERLLESLYQTYKSFASDRKDETFEARVELAKARALIRIAKAKTRRIELELKNNNRSNAMEVANEMQAHLRQAVRHLQTMP